MTFGTGRTLCNLYKKRNYECLKMIFNAIYVKPPSHSDKDHKDRTTFVKRDKRRENGTKCSKKHSFQVCSTSLLRSCQDVTASYTSQLRFVPRLIPHSPRPLRFNTFFLRPFRLHYARTARLQRPHCALRDLIMSSPRCPRLHSFCKFS